MASSTRTVAPVLEPLSLEDAREHLRVDEEDEDSHLLKLVEACRGWAEGFTRRALITQTWALYLDRFPSVVRVPNPPLQSVSSIQYVDTAGDTQTLSTSVYTVDTDAEPGLIYPAYSQDWPSTRAMPKAVTITYVAGYGAAATSVPEEIRHAMRLYLARLYEIREPVIVGARVEDSEADAMLLRPYQITEF